MQDKFLDAVSNNNQNGKASLTRLGQDINGGQEKGELMRRRPLLETKESGLAGLPSKGKASRGEV